jgi:hypothetical protein
MKPKRGVMQEAQRCHGESSESFPRPAVGTALESRSPRDPEKLSLGTEDQYEPTVRKRSDRGHY